jgi:hypothetical protein
MENKGLLPYSQQSATCSCQDPINSVYTLPAYFFYDPI